MRVVCYILLFVLMSFPSHGAPLSLPWGEEAQENIQDNLPKNFRYNYGSVSWGAMSFYGNLGDTSIPIELLLRFSNKRIKSAYLIISSDYLNEKNCLEEYKFILSHLKKKYGTQSTREIIKESIYDDLLFENHCYAIKVGVFQIIDKWKINDFEIEAAIFSEDRGIFIEIHYIYIPMKQKSHINLEKSL